MASRRWLTASKGAVNSEIGDDGDAVRLAAHLNIGGDVHAVVTHQHMTSHVRDNQTESKHVLRKSGVRKVTTRVVHQTTTITRGHTQTLTDKLTSAESTQRTCVSVRIGGGGADAVKRVAAIDFAPLRPCRRPKVTRRGRCLPIPVFTPLSNYLYFFLIFF